MTPFLSYLLKANLVLVLLYGFYLLCFRRDTFYGHIRWYLLATIVSAIAFPLVNISGWLAGSPAAMEVSQYVPDINVVYQYALAQPQTEYTVAVEPALVARTIPFALIIWWCWLSVTILLSGKRLFQLACIACLWWRYPRQHYGNKTIIAVNRDIQPFSFAGYIFLNPSLYSENELNEIVTHEQVHCRQGHTIDILLAEALVCLCWFNPVAWLLRRDLKQNLEYDTDRRTLQSGFDRKHYQYSLLRVSGNTYQIVNHFHFNHLKKRIIMMNKKESPRILTAKYMLVVPALVAALLTVQMSSLQAEHSSDSVSATYENEEWADRITIDDFFMAEKIITNVDSTENDSSYVVFHGDSPLLFISDDGTITYTKGEGDSIGFSGNVFAKKLVLIDGKEGSVKDIPSQNIEKMEITKGINGVVLITTKNTSQYHQKKSLFMPNSPKQKGDSIIPDYRIYNKTSSGLPLIVLDGEVIPNEVMSSIDPTTIESIDVLKDGAPRFYSSNQNGVIIVTTKRGTKRAPLFNPKRSLFLQNSLKQKGDSIITDYRTRQGTGYVSETKADAQMIQVYDTVTNSDSLLYIVDGKEVSSVANLSPDGIESITILKDQTATALYGEKAKNGVIIITTKK